MNEEKTLYDLSFLEDMSGGDAEFENEIITYFIQNAPGSIKSIKKLYADQNWEELRHVAHKFLSNANMMGLSIISREIETIEDIVTGDLNKEDILPLLAHIEKYCTIAISQLNEHLN